MDYEKERMEAIRAGEDALFSLKEARRHISSAKGFGLWDIFGGGTFVSLMKHYKIDNAKGAIEKAKYDLHRFSRELRDIQMDIDLDIGSFLTLFDLMDNFFADLMVQSRLSNAARRIDEAIAAVEDCLNRI